MLTTSPVKIINGEGITDSLSFFISFYNDYVIYELPYHVTKEIDNVLIYDSTKFEYFVYTKNQDSGFLLKNSNDSFVLKTKKDSVLNRRAYTEKIRSEDIFKEVEIKTSDYIVLSREKKIGRYIVEDKLSDSVYFFYDNKLKNIIYSLSESLDSINESKLYKIQIFLKKDSSVNANKLKDFFINCFEIKVRSVPDEIKSLFERYDKQVNNQMNLKRKF